MNQKKENIAVLAWRHVACPTAKAADPLSWIFFVVFIFVFVSGIFFRFQPVGSGGLRGFYDDNYAIFWYGAWLLLVISTIGPVFNLSRERNEVPLSVLIGIGVTHLVIFLIISVLVLTQEGGAASITALLAATAAAGMVGIGWVVQHQSGAKASRRTHTFNILMQSRLSKEFQDHVKRRGDHYTSGVMISADDAPLVSKLGLGRAEKAIDEQLEKSIACSREEMKAKLATDAEEEKKILQGKHLSLQSVKYLLNFYEFICAGILLRELDEKMIKETLGDIAKNLYKDTLYLRIHARNEQPEVYVNLDKVIDDVWIKGGAR